MTPIGGFPQGASGCDSGTPAKHGASPCRSSIRVRMPVTQVATKQRRSPAPRKRAAKAPRKRARPKTHAEARKASARKAKASKTNGAVSKPAASNERGGGKGGRRLATAFDAASRLPALAESRRRLLRASEGRASSQGELAEAVESDVALTIAVMRAAGDIEDEKGRTGGVRQAIEGLGAPGVREVVASVDTYDPFDSPGTAAERHERFRRHAVATRHAADRIAELARLGERDELAVAALVHDVGGLRASRDVRAVRPARRPEDGTRRAGAVRASGAGHRPCPGGRGPRPTLGLPTRCRRRGRATPHAGGRRTRGSDPARRPGRPPRPGRGCSRRRDG